MNANPELMRKLNVAAHRFLIFTNLLYKCLVMSFALIFNAVVILVFALSRMELVQDGSWTIAFDDLAGRVLLVMTVFHFEYWMHQFKQRDPMSHLLLAILIMMPISMAYLMAASVSPNSGTSMGAVFIMFGGAGLFALVCGYVLDIAIPTRKRVKASEG